MAAANGMTQAGAKGGQQGGRKSGKSIQGKGNYGKRKGYR